MSNPSQTNIVLVADTRWATNKGTSRLFAFDDNTSDTFGGPRGGTSTSPTATSITVNTVNQGFLVFSLVSINPLFNAVISEISSSNDEVLEIGYVNGVGSGTVSQPHGTTNNLTVTVTYYVAGQTASVTGTFGLTLQT